MDGETLIAEGQDRSKLVPGVVDPNQAVIADQEIESVSRHRQVNRFIDAHRPFLTVFVLFLAFRLPYLFVSRPQGYWIDSSDYQFYLSFARLSDIGLYPYLHYWLEYPPIFPWIAVLAYKLNLLIPYWHGDPLPTYRLALGILLLVFEAGNLCLIYLIARRVYGPDRAIWCGWVYSALFVPVYTMTGWFDNLPLFFLLLSVYLTIRGNHLAAAAFSGIGFMAKVFPIAGLAVAARASKPSRWPWLAIAAAVPIVSIAAPFILIAPQYFIASFGSMATRPPWETVWAIIEGYYGYGMLAPIAARPDPATAYWVPYVSDLPWSVIMFSMAVLYLLFWRLVGSAGTPRHVLYFAGLTTAWMLVASKGYSPQFLSYLLPFIVLTMPNLKGCFFAVVLTMLNFIELPIYHVVFPDQHSILIVVVIARTAILLSITALLLAALRAPVALPRLERALTRGAAAVATVGLLSALLVTGFAWKNMDDGSVSGSRIVRAVLTGASDAGIVVSDPHLYEELLPQLGGRMPVFLVDDEASADDDEPHHVRLDAVVAGRSEIWHVAALGNPEDDKLREKLRARARLMEVDWEGTLAAWRWRFVDQ